MSAVEPVAVEQIESLDFQPCDCDGLHPEHGTGDATWAVVIGCPRGCAHLHGFACDGCWAAYKVWEKRFMCTDDCGYEGPARDFIVDERRL